MFLSNFPFRHRGILLLAIFVLSMFLILFWCLKIISSFGTSIEIKRSASASDFQHLSVSTVPSDKEDTNNQVPVWIESFLQKLLNQDHQNLRVDKRKLNRIELLEGVADSIRNLPRPPFMSEQSSITAINESCAVSPSTLDVQFVNTYWQVGNMQFGTLFLYGAYYDNRNLTLKESSGPVVRILGMMDQYLEATQTQGFCQLRFENEAQPVISKIIEHEYIWYEAYRNSGNDSKLHPYLFTCHIPPTHHTKVPKSLSIAQNPCDNALNILGVQYTKPKSRKKNTFAVCVKGLHLPQEEDNSIRLVEWIELMRLLGAEKIFIYEYQVHPNISKVLEYYQSSGFVDITPITLPGYLPGEPRLVHLYHTNSDEVPGNWMNELISLNDCLYRNLHSYKYLAMIDTDEVIMPLGNVSTWNELIQGIDEEYPNEFAAISFRNIYHLDIFMKNQTWFPGIPWYMHILQHVYRARNYTHIMRAAKSFHRVDRVLTVNNHWPRNCLGGCKYFFLNETIAYLQHYKMECPSYVSNCTEKVENPIMETTVWKYKDKLIERMERVLKTLGFIPDIRRNSSWIIVQIPNDLIYS